MESPEEDSHHKTEIGDADTARDIERLQNVGEKEGLENVEEEKDSQKLEVKNGDSTQSRDDHVIEPNKLIPVNKEQLSSEDNAAAVQEKGSVDADRHEADSAIKLSECSPVNSEDSEREINLDLEPVPQDDSSPGSELEKKGECVSEISSQVDEKLEIKDDESEQDKEPSGSENEVQTDLSQESLPGHDASNIEVNDTENAKEEDISPTEQTASLDGRVRPSLDREDISDDELESDSPACAISALEKSVVQSNSVPADSSSIVELSLEPSTTANSGDVQVAPMPDSANVVMPGSNDDVMNADSTDMGDIIDLKLEDAVGKSEEGSLDNVSGPSKGPSDDLETVSDDELPETSQSQSEAGSKPVTSALSEGREDVSSSEDDGPASPDSAYTAAQGFGDAGNTTLSLETSEVSDGNISCSEHPNTTTEKPEIKSAEGETGPVSSDLASLEAEPISDEDDMDQDKSASPMEVEGGEAGEVRSPGRKTPPPVEELLREVEPISADESSDTDGELPSGDEDQNKDDAHQSNTNFESIESDEEGNVAPPKEESKTQVENEGDIVNSASADSVLKKDSEYMDPISDEEATDGVGKEKKDQDTAVSSKDLAMEKKPESATFNEHHEELDYEENDGEEGDAKPEELKVTPAKEDEEEGECDDEGDRADDKDEGEVSDDDCEEGEIKEPGTRKTIYQKPVCRFFQRGHCTWGINCRFLHPGINDKGNYQMIEIPGFKPPHPPPGVPAPWEEPEEPIELPPPPMPDIPPQETAWERGLRIAKEQRKKASERKEKETDFEEKRLNLSLDEERDLNKENERMPKIIPKDPYYDQQAFEEDEYYKIPQDPWHTGHYENFEVRYNREHSFSPPYRGKPSPHPPPPSRYNQRRSYSPPPNDKFNRQKMERREPFRPEPPTHDYAPDGKRPDEWTDPWRRNVVKEKPKPSLRSKSPHKRKGRSRSRGRKSKRSVSDSSNSSRSGSGSSSGSSRSSRSGSGSSDSSSNWKRIVIIGHGQQQGRSRSPEPAPPGVERNDRYGGHSPPRYGDGPRSAVSVRGRSDNYRGGGSDNYRGGGSDNYRGGGGGRGGYNHQHHFPDQGFRNNRGGYRGRGGRQDYGGYRGRGRGGYYHHNNDGGGGGNYFRGGPPHRDWGDRGGDHRDMRGRDPRQGRPRGRSPPDRPLPYTRPHPRSTSSHSSSSRSGSRSRSRSDSSRSRSSSNSSRSSSNSSSSSGGSADSEHLYRDLGSPSRSGRGGGGPGQSMAGRRKRTNSHKDRMMSNKGGPPPSGSKYLPPGLPPSQSASQDRMGREPKSTSGRDHRSSGGGAGSNHPLGRSEKYASRNAPQPPVKAKDPLKVVGQKSNIKLTLLPKQQQSSLGARPNPLDSPPPPSSSHKRRVSERDVSPSPVPPPKRVALPVPTASALRIATDKAAKLAARQGDRGGPPPGTTAVPPPPASSTQRAKVPISPHKLPSGGATTSATAKPREPLPAKTAPKMAPPPLPPLSTGSASAAAGLAGASGGKAKKSMSSRREELLKQLKAVEDAIARKKQKL